METAREAREGSDAERGEHPSRRRARRRGSREERARKRGPERARGVAPVARGAGEAIGAVLTFSVLRGLSPRRCDQARAQILSRSRDINRDTDRNDVSRLPPPPAATQRIDAPLEQMSAFTLSSTFNVAQTAGLSKARAAKVRPRGDAIAPTRENDVEKRVARPVSYTHLRAHETDS